MVDGKAQLLFEDYCDGLGDCLPACPMDAISFETREAKAYNEAAVKQAQKSKVPNLNSCPSTVAKSRLTQWPCQIKLVPENAPYFDGANLLIAADCTAFAYGNFHEDFIKNHITLIGCPKLDSVDYSEKLSRIIAQNNIKSITIVRMEVPCCSGLEAAVKKALQRNEQFIPCQVRIITTDGKIFT